MSEWEEIFKTWEDYSPYLHRILLTRKELKDWLEKLGLMDFSFEEENMYILMDCLEELNLFHPIKLAKRGSEFGQKQEADRGIFYFQKPSEEKLNENSKYYHPFQFFQLVMFWNCYKQNFNKESQFYYYLQKKKVDIYEKNEKIKRKIISKIEKDETKWVKNTNKAFTKGLNSNVDKSTKMSKREKKQQKKKNFQGLKEINKQKKVYLDLFYPKLKHSYWLTIEFLKIWIKVDSLSLYGEYLVTPNGSNIRPILNVQSKYDKKERSETLKKYNKWREDITKDKKNFLNEDEIKILKQLYSTIYEEYIHASKNRINGLEKWQDLIDMIPNNKLSELYGNLNISINILSILRHLVRLTWELFEYNLISWPKNKESESPYCYLTEESDVIEFRRSVLSDFRLFVSSPFILYVEGESEKTIMNLYFKIKGLWFPIAVENIGGIDKTIQTLTIGKIIKERAFYFFLDYENEQKYNNNKSLIGEHGDFFFPDFVTENFNPEEILKLFTKYFNSIGGTLTEGYREFLSEELFKCKEESKLLIQMEKKEGNPKSYEKILINFLIKKYPEILIKKYPDCKIDGEHPYPNKRKFKQKFKEVFTEKYIVTIIKNALEIDPDRKGEKFAFENKLTPFYDSINQYIYRNDILRYNFDI
ncbi:MAG: hypothetical protein ACFFDF_20995 [Candidatus Odinarchaeota archaeon]